MPDAGSPTTYDLMYQHFLDLYWNSRSGQHAMADLSASHKRRCLTLTELALGRESATQIRKTKHGEPPPQT